MRHNEAVIYDLEYTTWSGALERSWSGKDEYREIIRIGAISIDLDSLQEIEALDVIVKPSVNPTLSNYCTKLTGVTDEQIQAEGLEIHEAIHKFVDFVGKRNIFSLGLDILIILETLRLKNVTFNAKTLKSDRPIILREYHEDIDNQIESDHESNVVEVFLYGSGFRDTVKELYEGVSAEINLQGEYIQFIHTNLRTWFYVNAPETQGKYSGEIAKTLGISEGLKGNMHDPLFDARSILMGLRELVLCRHIENPLKQ